MVDRAPGDDLRTAPLPGPPDASRRPGAVRGRSGVVCALTHRFTFDDPQRYTWVRIQP